ncbi:MAG: hypothetical protein KJ072_21580, partial [Verrucomicrobia bacterium]|nr:hypothetical protein [Verrucomicrobiota bacterium]
MNTLVENIPAKTVVAPTRLPGKPAHRILVVEDNAVIRELNVRVTIAPPSHQVRLNLPDRVSPGADQTLSPPPR